MTKYNLNCENQVIRLMITDSKKWHYVALKILSALLRGITIIMKAFILLKKHYNQCKNHDYRYVEMHKEDNKTLTYNPKEKYIKLHLLFMLTHSPFLKK